MSALATTTAASAVSNSLRGRRVYVTHSIEDSEWALEFTDALCRLNVDAELDRDRLDVDTSSFGLLERHLERCTVVIAVFPSTNILRSKLHFEIGVALAAGKILVPVITRDAGASDAPVTGSSARHVVWRDAPDRAATAFVEVLARLDG